MLIGILIFFIQILQISTQDQATTLPNDEILPTLTITVTNEGKPLEGIKTLEVTDIPVSTTEQPQVVTSETVTPEYKPPPTPTPRNVTSEGICYFDSRLWRVESQSAIANAVMFERRSGISCEECLRNCQFHQDENAQWICRTLTYDHRWKICDLYAVSGTVYPQYLIDFPGRDYFEYTIAREPTAAEITVGRFESEFTLKKSIPIRVSGFPITPNTPIMPKPWQDRFARKNMVAMSGQSVETKTEIPVEKAAQGKHEPVLAVLRDANRRQSTESCEEGEITRYALIMNVDRANPGTDTQLVKVKTPEECAKACDKDELFTCVSATLTNLGCELSPTPADHAMPQEFNNAERSIYLEKVCLKEKVAEHTRILWPTVRNHVLIGHVHEVTDADTLDECQMACLRAEQEYGFVCQSGMWYPSDDEQNCLLNTETRYTQSEVFVPEEPNVQMLYFDVPRDEVIDNSNAARWYKDDPLKDGIEDPRYTVWSKCNDRMDSVRSRYLKCKDRKDVRKCPKETQPCNLRVKSLKHECVAVRDALGQKRCPHGLRRLPDGSKEYCKKPVDC